MPAGVQGLQTEWNKKTLTYALLVADTVVAQGGGAKPEVLTSHAPKGWSDVAYYFKVGLLSLLRQTLSWHLVQLCCLLWFQVRQVRHEQTLLHCW